MTDKQIIIDGVNVSGCKHFKIGTCLADYLSTDMDFSEAKCELCKDCYYKQLKHREQECNKFYTQLKADEECHKEEENTLRKIIKNKEERNIELYKENNKLKQTLNEIKEIAKAFCDGCQEFEPEKRGINCIYCNYGKIIQLIRESEIKHES